MSSGNAPGMTPRPATIADRLARPFVRFLELETSSAILLLLGAAIALVWANSPWGDTYDAFWHTPLALELGRDAAPLFEVELSLAHWVNDGLMVIFFFVVGMEIKRELVLGELSSRQRAMLPILGAAGGMIVPAGIYAAFHMGEPTIRGWGIPMATDIAFAVAALSVLGSRVPPGLRIFLLALAIADDLGAVAVIAVFYTAEIHLGALAWAGGGLVACWVLNRAGVQSILVYACIGVFVWYETHHSGVHATIAGVMLGFLTPTRRPRNLESQETLVERGRSALEHLRELILGDANEDVVDYGGHRRHHATQQLSWLGRRSLSPLDFLVNLLERPVAYVVMPLFALANAGVVLDAATLGESEAQWVAIAVALGLLVGKPIGITLFSWVAVRSGIAKLPRGVGWGGIAATGLLAGIGFTVALFVTALAFTEMPIATAGSKIGILVGSLIATILGVVVLHQTLPAAPGPGEPLQPGAESAPGGPPAH